MKKYIVRERSFPRSYEWETSTVFLGKIYGIYMDQLQARSICRSLAIEALFEYPLSHYSLFVGGSNSHLLPQVKQFALEKTGIYVSDHDWYPVLERLSEEELQAFLDISGISKYEMFEIEDTQKLYVLWICAKGDYLRHGEDNSILFGDNSSFITTDEMMWLHQQGGLPEEIHGDLHEISEFPVALQALFSVPWEDAYDYDQDAKKLNLRWYSYNGIEKYLKLNHLLKHKLMELRQLSIYEIIELS